MIEVQRFAIEQRRELTGALVIESMVEAQPNPSKEEKEKLLGGALAITVYKGESFEINLPVKKVIASR